MAYTYTGTPSERILQAKNRVTNESVNGTLSNYLKVNTGEQEQAIENGVKNASVGEKIGDTLGDIFKNIASGVEKAFEGIADFGASTVGVIAGWAGNDTLKDDMSKFVARDLVTEGWQDLASKGYDVDFANSAINDLSETGQNIVRGVSQGVGQMLPMVITTALTGGTSLATLGNVANWGGFAMSAAGTGTESALNDVDSNGNPVSLDRAYLYGLAEGAKELATEMIVGGVVWDKGILDNVVGNLAKNVRFGKLVKLGLNSLGEGFEEVVGEVFENTLQTIYKDDNFHWESPDAASVIENGIIGSLTAAVLGSGQSAMVKASNTMTIQEEMANLKENEDYVQRMQDKGNYDEKVESRYTQEKERATNEISKRLKKMTDEKREKAFAKSPQLATLFDAKGNIKSTQLNEGVTAIENRSQAIQNGTLDARITDTNKVANVLRNASVSIESGQDAKFKLSESLNETESKNLETFKKLNQLVGKDTGINTKFAVYEQQEKITNKEGNNVTGNAFINGDVVYINKSRLQNENDVYKAFAHEVIGHFTENTNEHNALVKVASEILGEERVSQIEKSIKENYKEDAIESEIDAHIVEEFLSEKGTKYIEELATKNESLAKKFKAKVDKVIKYIESVFKGDKEALQELKSLRKMSKLIEGTLAKGGMKYVAKEYAKQSGLEEFLDGVNTQFNIATWKEKCIITKINKDGSLVIKSGKEILTEYLEKTGMSSEEIKELYTDSIDKVSDIVEELSKEYDVLKDFKNIKPHYRPDGSLMLTCLVSNGEYELNIDFTTICKKRESLAKFLTEYQEQGYSFGKNGFNKGNQTTLENLLKKYGLDTACTFCFVEARRKNVDTWSEKFYTLWSDALRLAGYKNAKPISQVEALKDIDVVNGIKTNIDSKELTDELAFDVANLVESDALNLKEDNDAAMQAGYKMFDDAYKEYVKKLKEQYEKDLKAGLVKEKKNGVKDDTEARMLAAMAKIFKENPDKIFTLEKEDLYNTRVITYIKAAIPDMYSVLLTSYGANAPKQTLPAAPYTSNVFVDKAFNNKKKNYTTYTKSIGGTRMNSFSDFQISRVLDYVQYIADASAKGMCIQSYTKELAMVELFGKCGLKINMSLIPEIDLNVSSENAGLDANGNYIFSSDSADFRRTIELQEIDGIKGNCGSVLVGISDGQIRKALSDDRIKMIIPYHSSGMPKHLKVFFHHDGYYKDYQPYQNTKNPANPKYTDKFLKVFYESYVRNKGNSKAAADDYLAFCEKNKLIPRFAQEWNTDLSFKENLANPKNFIPAHENYYKVLIDFTSDLGNGKFAEQEPVKLNLNFEQTKDKDGKVLIDSFKNIVSRESSKLQENMAQYEKAIKNGIFDDFQKEIKENDKISEESVVKKQQAIRDERIQNKENKENTIYENIQFSKSVDSEGNQLSVEQEKYFKDSKVRDENGNLIVMYEGTNAEFTKFDKNYIGKTGRFEGAGFNFTPSKARASSYGNNVMSGYLNIVHPLSADKKTISIKDLANIIKEIDATGDNIISNYAQDTFDYGKQSFINRESLVTAKIIWESAENDVDIYSDLSVGNPDSVSQIAKFEGLGYDGLIHYYDNGKIKTAVAFESNQFKNIDNYNPTTDNDIRFSKSIDSDGNQLSVEQEDFFKDSKARDENGNLLSLWSGTQNGEFFVFKGDEIYFTDNKAVAESYRYRYKDKPHNLTLYNAYLNMKNPLIVNAKGKNWDEIRYKAYNREDVIESINKEIERYEKLIDELENSNRALKDVQIKNFKEEIRDYKRELRNVDIHTTEDIVWEARKLGYDGVIIKNVIDTAANVNGNEVGSDYVVFAPNQVKNVNNYNPTSSNDIRFSKNVELTEAVKKSVDEIFNKETAEMGIVTDNDIHDIVNNAIKLAADTPRPYAELVCQEIADNIINKAHIVSVYYTQEDVEELKKEKQILDGYKHKFKFSEKDREEIKYTFDKDAKTIYLMWSAKNGGVETDVFYSELEGKTGFITESLTGIDQFKDFLDYYNEISNKIKSAQEIDGTDIKSAKWDNEILYDIRDKIRDDLIEAVLPYVDKSKKEQSIARNKELEKSYKVATETIEKLKKDLDRAKTRVEKYNQRANEAYERNKTTNKIIDIAKKFSKEELKKYPNASMLGDAQFNLALSAIAKLVHRGDLGKVGARKAIDKINEWYTDKNTFLQASDEQGGTLFNAEIKDAMESIVENTKAHPNRAFTNEELKNVLRIVQHIQHLMKTYDEFTKAGKKASVKKTATEGIDVARQMSKFSNTNKLFAMIKKFGEWIVEPRVFIRQLFGYQSNPISEIYEDIVDGETRASKVRMDILQPLSEFYKEHKNYKKSLSEKVTFMGKSITKAELISLYKYEKQEHSRGALHSTGFGMINEKTRMFEEYGVLDDSSVSEMNSLLNETDKAYIQAVEESMKIGAKYQIETDYDYKGFTFIDEDATEFYLPIKRWSGDFAKSMQETYMDAIRVDAAGNQSISKQRTNNVRRIQVRPIDSIVENYAKQCGTYAGLAVPIKNFERVLNFNIGSVNKPISIRNILNEQVSADAMPYLANLLNDIQGISDKSSQVTIFGKIRGNYAKFQLGANLKVIMSQMASYPTAFTELRASSMTKAFTHKIDFKDMDKYSDWAKARNYFDDVVRSEGILENVDKFTDLFTKPIQWTDRLTIAAIWNACQVEIETNHKGDSTYKYGTEENKKEAAKLLEHIGRTTQPNYTTTERTQLQRSKNEFMKTLAMFTAVPSKQVSRLIEAVGQTRAYVWKKKNGLKVTEQEAKQVKVYLAKTISAISLANIVYVMMGELVKFLFNKDREKDGEEISLGEDIGWDFLSTTIGMFPIVKNIYSYFVDGYDLDSGSYLTGGLEDILSSTKDIIELTSSVVSGNNVDSSEWYKALKSYSYGLGQVTGLPTRNIYNMVYGLTKRFDTSSAYKISSLFTSSTQYTKDLNQALKDGDENLATTIVGLIMEDDSMTSTSKAVNEKIKDLYSKGYSVLPKSVKDSVSYDGETYSLNANQQKVIKSMYQEANSDIESLIKSASFTSLDEAIQSRTIKWLYDYYYEYGVSETLGLTANSKKLLFGEMMDIKKFAMAVSSCQNLQADKDSDGNTINGSKKTKVESLLRKLTLTQGEREIIKAYLGYTADENVLKRYAKSVGLTKKQQEIFLKYC